MRKIFLIFSSIILVLGFVYFLNNLEKIEPVKASPGSEHNVSGWAWAGGGEIGGSATATIGWISFNCNNPELPEPRCTNNYGVNIDGTGLFSGYAWSGGVAAGSASGTIGWISFSTSSLVGCPGGACEARLNTANNQVSGWARACSVFQSGCSGATSTNTGGWDGWIKLRGQTTEVPPKEYGVSLNPTTKEFEGWAWGGDDSSSTAVIGWISFNCKNRDWCATSSYKVTTSVALAPVISNLTSTFESPCYPGQSRIPKLSWEVNADPPYDYYKIEIATTSDFSSPIVSETSSPSTYSTSWLPQCSGYCDVSPYNKIEFGQKTYNWRVKVAKDGKESNWAMSTFDTLSHAYPYPDFSPSPRSGTVGEVITFNNTSTCYDTSCTYQWDFENDGIFDLSQSVKANATTTYDKTGKKTVKLRITDNDLGEACETTQDVNIQARLPWWKEILPF